MSNIANLGSFPHTVGNLDDRPNLTGAQMKAAFEKDVMTLWGRLAEAIPMINDILPLSRLVDVVNNSSTDSGVPTAKAVYDAIVDASLGGGAQQIIEDWLDAHPEATTTVQDGSITNAKLATSFVTPGLSLAFVADTFYPAGSYVFQSGVLYTNTEDVNDSVWTAAHWKQAALSDDVSYLNAFAKHVDGKVDTPEFELGDIYVNDSGVKAYYPSTSRVRIKMNTSIYLNEGTIVGLSNYNGYRILMYLDNGNGTYSTVGGWKQEDITIHTTGNYLIILSYSPETTITSAEALVNLLNIKYNSTFDKLVDMLGEFNILNKQVRNISGADFELGDLYVNGSGVGTYYASNSRIRTIQDNPISLEKGTIVGLSDYTNATYIIRKRVSQGHYTEVSGPNWKTVDLILPEDGDYEALIRYPTEATITDMNALASLFQIKSKHGVFVETTNIQNMTDVYNSELQTSIDTARSKTTSRGLMFGIVTDTHLDGKRVMYYNQTMENLERLNNGLCFNGIIHLGDIVNGYDTSAISQFHLGYAMERLLKIAPDKTYVVVGNHDNNQGAGDSERLSGKQVYSLIHRYNEQFVNRSMEASSSVYEDPTSDFYVDYDNLKMRVIFFDSCYYSEGFSENTIAWVSATMAGAPSDYKFVLFTHLSPESELNAGYVIGNASAFKAVLETYASRICCYIHGHSHYDYVGYPQGFAEIALCSAVPDQPSSSVPAGGVQPTRTLGTVTQDCISVIIILPSENKVELVRFGAGSDNTIPFTV